MCAEKIVSLTIDAYDSENYRISLFIERKGRVANYWLDCRQTINIEKHDTWQRSVGAGYIEALLCDLQQAKIPALPDQIMGLDGATYELIFNRGMNGVTYRWWNGTPKGYESVARFADELKKLAGVEDW